MIARVKANELCVATATAFSRAGQVLGARPWTEGERPHRRLGALPSDSRESGSDPRDCVDALSKNPPNSILEACCNEETRLTPGFAPKKFIAPLASS